MTDWRPNPGPQTRFLSLTAYEALYGGAAGGGKSDAILVDAVRYVGRGYGGAYQALLLRRTFPELEKGLILRSQDLYRRIGGEYSTQAKTWTFPGGERVVFGYLDSEQDVYRYQGLAFQFIGYDELTQFSLHQYTYLLSRLRHAGEARFPLRARGTTNPGGSGHEWVFARWGAWLDPAKRCADPGQVLYAVRGADDVERFVPKGSEPVAGGEGAERRWYMTANDGTRFEVSSHMTPLGRTFVPAKLEDNPALASDPTYKRGLDELDPVQRAQLRDGNWLVKPGAGAYFKRTWIRSWVDFIAESDVVQRVRAWDLGATTNGDWTRGVRMARLRDDSYVVEHVASLRGTPGDVQRFIRSTAESDGAGVKLRLPLDPGQAGLDQQLTYAKLLSGFIAEWKRPTGDKTTRFGPFSTQAQAGNVAVKRGAWVDEWVGELEAFPDGANDDQVDATADALNELGIPVRIEAPTDTSPDFRSYDDSGGDDPPFDFAD